MAWIDPALYAVGLAVLLTLFLPFSPMTIDLVNLSREAQIAIYRHRAALWAVAALAFALLVVRGLAGTGWLGLGGPVGPGWDAAAPGWLWAALVTIGVMAMMFWSGYVPFVMSPPANPRLLSAAEAGSLLDDDDMVLGVAHGGEARAYSRDLIARPHYYADTVGGQKLTVSYCILCNSAIGFVAELDGRPLELACVTAYNNNIIYRDAARDNFIQQLDGEVFAGPDAGKRLTPYPVVQMTWGAWRRLNPETTFYHAPPRGLRDRLVGAMLKWLIPVPKLARRSKPWHRVRGQVDDRLPAMSFVLGVEAGGERAAYPLAELQRSPVLHDRVGGRPIVIFADGERDAAAVFEPLVEGQPAEFRAHGPGRFEDLATGSVWDLTGRAVKGPKAGQQLAPVAHFNKLFWFSWALFKPGTRIGPAPA